MRFLVPILMIVSSYYGSKMAEEKGYNPLVWAVLCGLFPILAILVLLLPYKPKDEM